MPAPNILIIDDEDELRSELVELVSALGADVVGVQDGTGARDACRSTAFDLVLCDYKLRIENGLHVLRSLSTEYRDAAAPDVYLMTGHVDLTKAARADIAELTMGLLMKPISMGVLRNLVALAKARAC